MLVGTTSIIHLCRDDCVKCSHVVKFFLWFEFFVCVLCQTVPQQPSSRFLEIFMMCLQMFTRTCNCLTEPLSDTQIHRLSVYSSCFFYIRSPIL